jgi:NTP pyrophosphatase (non-canonical NTP hydrolase)
MDQLDYSMDEYQANVLRTANRQLTWNGTIENCLLGLIGELSEVITDLKTDSPLLNAVAGLGIACESVKKIKYHGKQKDLFNQLSYDQLTLAEQSMKEVTFTPNDGSNLPKETGDVLYYLTWLVDTLGHELGKLHSKTWKNYVNGMPQALVLRHR